MARYTGPKTKIARKFGEPIFGDDKSFEKRRKLSLKNNKYRGIGISTYIEACGGGGPEYCYLKIGGNGNVEVKIGTQSNGQGHLTSYSQIVSEVLDIDINQINNFIFVPFAFC